MTVVHLVPTGKPEPDVEIVAELKGLLARAESGEVTDLFVVFGTAEDRDVFARCPTDTLGLVAFTEEVARSLKCRALGLGDE